MAINQEFQKFRKLDFDDFCLLTLLADGHSPTKIAKYLFITPPAISHRLAKYATMWGSDIYDQKIPHQSRRTLTKKGIDLCKKMKLVLYFFMQLPEDFKFVSLFE